MIACLALPVSSTSGGPAVPSTCPRRSNQVSCASAAFPSRHASTPVRNRKERLVLVWPRIHFLHNALWVSLQFPVPDIQRLGVEIVILNEQQPSSSRRG